jgi:hypothetical protein
VRATASPPRPNPGQSARESGQGFLTSRFSHGDRSSIVVPSSSPVLDSAAAPSGARAREGVVELSGLSMVHVRTKIAPNEHYPSSCARYCPPAANEAGGGAAASCGEVS